MNSLRKLEFPVLLAVVVSFVLLPLGRLEATCTSGGLFANQIYYVTSPGEGTPQSIESAF